MTSFVKPENALKRAEELLEVCPSKFRNGMRHLSWHQSALSKYLLCITSGTMGSRKERQLM